MIVFFHLSMCMIVHDKILVSHVFNNWQANVLQRLKLLNIAKIVLKNVEKQENSKRINLLFCFVLGKNPSYIGESC